MLFFPRCFSCRRCLICWAWVIIIIITILSVCLHLHFAFMFALASNCLQIMFLKLMVIYQLNISVSIVFNSMLVVCKPRYSWSIQYLIYVNCMYSCVPISLSFLSIIGEDISCHVIVKQKKTHRTNSCVYLVQSLNICFRFTYTLRTMIKHKRQWAFLAWKGCALITWHAAWLN